MGKTITTLRFQKRNRNRVNVYLDGQFAFGLAAIEAARLRVGQVLDDDDVTRLQRQDEVERGYERALNLISYRPRSEAEVRRNLSGKGDRETVEEVVTRLVQAGLLNDREFAHYWIENRVQFNPRGRRALRQELREKGVAAPVISDALEDFDEEAVAHRAADAGARRLVGTEAAEFRRKLTAYLARRGFTYATIQPLVRELLGTTLEASPEIESGGEDDDE